MRGDLVVTAPPLALALTIEPVAIEDVLPYAANARDHSAEQVAEIAASIHEFGFVNPILIDGAGVLVAGHGRVLAAKQLAYGVLPAIRLGHLSEAQARALRIADNKIALNSTWDLDLLRAELSDLKADGVDLALVGFGTAELRLLFASAKGLTDLDAVPPLEGVAVSRLGDVWTLGEHRLVCGDSTDAAIVSLAIGDPPPPNLMVTDPPYGVKYDPAWRARMGLGSFEGNALGEVLNDDQADWRKAWRLFPGAVAYVWHSGLHSAEVLDSFTACKFKLRAQIVWVKPRAAISRGHYHWQHEPCAYLVREGADDRFEDDHEIASYAVRDGEPGAWRVARRPAAIDGLEHDPPGVRDRAWDAKAGGGDAPPDAEQLGAGRCGV